MISLPGQLGHGMPAGDPLQELARTVKNLQAQVDQLRASQQQIIQVAEGTFNGTPPNDGTWRSYATTNTITAPGSGFDRLTWFMWADAGQSFTSTGVIGAAGEFNPLSGCPLSGGFGQSVSNSSGTATSMAINAPAFWMFTSTGWAAAAGATFNFRTSAYYQGAGGTGTGNAHTNAFMYWTRS